MFNVGDRVIVPDDDSGQVEFDHPGEQLEGVEVAIPVAVAPTTTRDVGWVRYPDGTTKTWTYAQIKHA